MAKVGKYLFILRRDNGQTQGKQQQIHMARQILLVAITAIPIVETLMEVPKAQQRTRHHKRMGIVHSECFGLTVMVEFIGGHARASKKS
jgi:hypothetical protein